jgi:hypothetical protein
MRKQVRWGLTFGIIQGTFGIDQGTFNIIQGTFGISLRKHNNNKLAYARDPGSTE